MFSQMSKFTNITKSPKRYAITFRSRTLRNHVINDVCVHIGNMIILSLLFLLLQKYLIFLFYHIIITAVWKSLAISKYTIIYVIRHKYLLSFLKIRNFSILTLMVRTNLFYMHAFELFLFFSIIYFYISYLYFLLINFLGFEI